MADHLRPWKQVQRDFHQIEDAKLKAAEAAEAARSRTSKPIAQIEAIDAKIEAAEAARRGERQRDPRRRRGAPTRSAGRFDAARHREAVPEGRARQPAQPLRRHDRPRRGAPRPGPTSTRRSSPSERKLLALDRGVREGRRRDAPRPRRRRPTCSATSTTSMKEKERLTRDVERAKRLVEQKEAQYFGPLAWLRGPPRDRPGRPADQDPADQPARPDDQLQLQGRPPLRPLHHLPPGDRPARLRQGRRGQADAARSSPRTPT